MQNQENLLSVVSTLFKWRRPLILLTGVAAIGSALLSLLLPNYFTATTRFLAVSPDQARPEYIFGGQENPRYFGNEDDIDRLLTIAESNELVDHLVDSFQLFDHYQINPTNAKAQYRVRRKFRSRLEIIKTKRDALEFSFEDTDPELAAAVVNGARLEIDRIARALIKEGQYQTLVSLQEGVRVKEKQLTILGDSLAQLRQRYQIYNTKTQSEALTTQFSETASSYVRQEAKLQAMEENRSIPRDTVAFVQAEVQGLKREYDTLSRRMEMLNEGQILLNNLESQYYNSSGQVSADLERVKLLEAAYLAQVPALLTLETAEVPVVKSRPRRSILVLAATALAFFLGIIGILLLDTYRDINWRKILHG